MNMDLKLLQKVGYGLYVISSVKDGRPNGQIANAVMQISAEPATLAISVAAKNLTTEYISASKVFTVSVLPESVPLDVVGRFGFKSGREMDKFEGVKTIQGANGVPAIAEHACIAIECEVVSSMVVETHTIFVGKIVNIQAQSEEQPITYAGYYEKKLAAPKAAVGQQKCNICGYVYDPAQHGGVAFEELPEDYECPICHVGKDKFHKV